MRTSALVGLFSFCCFFSANVDEAGSKQNPPDLDSTYRELVKGLPKEGDRAKSARLELDYWYGSRFNFLRSLERKSVKTKDGKTAEVVMLRAPSTSMPGTDFSMAFLLVEKRVVDWASCWSYNRTANHELRLEDVDGDGFLDVAFGASEGWWGLLDKRAHRCPKDKRVWLYAYAITSSGFQSLFPKTDRDLQLKVSYNPAGFPVKLRLEGLPDSISEYQMCECTISVTNTSKGNFTIGPGKWFSLKGQGVSFSMNYRLPERTLLKPGETATQTVRFYLTLNVDPAKEKRNGRPVNLELGFTLDDSE